MALLKVTLVVLFGATVVIGAIATALWGPHARARRRLREGTAAIADRELVTLEGTVHTLGEPLVAPLSGKSCVAYEASARVGYDELDAAGSNEDVLEEQAMQAFALLLASGERMIVDGERAELAARPAPVLAARDGRRAPRDARHGATLASGSPSRLASKSATSSARSLMGSSIASCRSLRARSVMGSFYQAAAYGPPAH